MRRAESKNTGCVQVVENVLAQVTVISGGGAEVTADGGDKDAVIDKPDAVEFMHGCDETVSAQGDVASVLCVGTRADGNHGRCI